MKIILFDIDKTLIKNFEIKGDIWKDLFMEVYGSEGGSGVRKIMGCGRTHKQLVFEVLSNEGFRIKDIDAKWPLFRKTFVEKCIYLLERVELFDDIDNVLKSLKMKGFELGLITGNLEEIAMAKLKLAKIEHYFSFGGFGDNLNRYDVAKEAVSDIVGGEVFFVGDTPLDILSGKKVGAITIGVTTGIYSKKELKDAGADIVIDNLKQLEGCFDE